jgi:hypothetical protein
MPIDSSIGAKYSQPSFKDFSAPSERHIPSQIIAVVISSIGAA